MLSAANLSRRIELLEEKQRNKSIQHVLIDKDVTRLYVPGQNDKVYIPNATAHSFHNDDSFVRLVMGAYGSGKSTLCVHEIVRRACSMPRWHHNRRRSRWAIVRNTSGELQTTTLKTWLSWFEDLGDVTKRQKPIMTYECRFNDGHGVVEIELIFLALDRPQDVGKIKSLELTGCYINECSEVPQAALSHMKGRVNRYPSHGMGIAHYWAGVIADTNPPDEDSWIYQDFEEKQLESYKIFKQPPGLLVDQDGRYIRNPDADNMNNLPADYYLKLAEGQTQEFINVFCLGKYGTVGIDKRVYTDFNSDLHAVSELKPIQGLPLYLGWDFGLTPACVVCQLTPRGTLLILKEYIGVDIGIRSFAESVVIPGIKRDFVYNKVGKSVADPAGNNRNEIMHELSCIGELNSLGIETTGASTNDIEPRLGAVRFFLNRMLDGKPALLVNKKECPVIYKGFVKDYVFKRVAVSGEERYKDKPHKNMASHPMDGLGYICLELASVGGVQTEKQFDINSILNPGMR